KPVYSLILLRSLHGSGHSTDETTLWSQSAVGQHKDSLVAGRMPVHYGNSCSAPVMPRSTKQPIKPRVKAPKPRRLFSVSRPPPQHQLLKREGDIAHEL